MCKKGEKQVFFGFLACKHDDLHIINYVYCSLNIQKLISALTAFLPCKTQISLVDSFCLLALFAIYLFKTNIYTRMITSFIS